MAREKGVETISCPNCGTDRPVSEQPDGSKVAERCEKCWPAEPAKEKAAHAKPAREHGTTTEKE